MDHAYAMAQGAAASAHPRPGHAAATACVRTLHTPLSLLDRAVLKCFCAKDTRTATRVWMMLSATQTAT